MARSTSGVQEGGGHSATVKGTEHGGEHAGILRINFPGSSADESLEDIGWDTFFTKFEGSQLAFAGLRAAGLDADARPHRGRPPLGAETAPTADLRRRGTTRPRRPPAAEAGRPLALDRDATAARPSRPADQPEPHHRSGRRHHQGPWNPARRRDSRAARHRPDPKRCPGRRLRPANQRL
jgi:hypothetical protein